jgi:hypothetical protein
MRARRELRRDPFDIRQESLRAEWDAAAMADYRGGVTLSDQGLPGHREDGR